MGAALGLGVEWFPFQRVSLGGQTGIGMDYYYRESDSRGSSHRSSSTSWNLYLRTFQSEVKALMYF
ncbi:MAG: hypothetical protein OXG96_09440 [Acidobacteria bacterium]|nr:hypothetical protein [Acidobacteriota bacterium]